MKHSFPRISLAVSLFLVVTSIPAQEAVTASPQIKVLVIDGQNNHKWQSMTPFMKTQMEKTGFITVDVTTTPPKAPGKPRRRKNAKGAQQPPKETAEQITARKNAAAKIAKAWEAWRPNFSDYQVIVSNYNGELWPEEVREDYTAFVKSGGGVLIVHAANNAFPQWKEFNEMIGLGWRNAKFGKRVYLNADGKPVLVNAHDGSCKCAAEKNHGCLGAGHGPQHEYQITIRDTEHPITKGMPPVWMHTKDELYHGQRGPAANMQILASAHSVTNAPGRRGTGVYEPMLWVIPYGKGKVVTNVMGHENGKALQCVGFITLMNRSIEWLATGTVTIPVPKTFPTAEKSSSAIE